MLNLKNQVVFICGRYTVFSEAEIIEMHAIIEEIGRKFGSEAIKTGEIFPTNVAPVLTLNDNRLAPYPVSWGFPRWDGKGTIINARSETALEKRMFSKSLLTRRCVIPSTGFFEWLHVDGKAQKDKFLFCRPGKRMLFMAGMIDTFKGADGVARDTFVILTTGANASMSPFHDRMPVILSPEERENWIADESFMRLVLARKGPELIWEKAG